MSTMPIIENPVIHDLDEADEFLEENGVEADEVEAILMNAPNFGGNYAIISLIEDGEEIAETCTFEEQYELKEFLQAAFGMDVPIRTDRL